MQRKLMIKKSENKVTTILTQDKFTENGEIVELTVKRITGGR